MNTSSKPLIETDVLVVGSGPAGATSAALLGMYGVKHLLVTKFGWLADTPRAHITNQRAMEVLRELGVEQKVIAQGTPQNLMANNVFCDSLAGEEFGRLYSWGNHPTRRAEYELASPTSMCDVPQNLLEPILLEAAGQRGTAIRFNSEFVDLVQNSDHVTATITDRLSGESYQIRAKYLIGADGARSRVAEVVGLPMEGQMGLSGSMNIVAQVDLTKYVAHRPSVLYWVLQPGARMGVGAGVVRMVRPWNEWLFIWGYDMERGAPKISTDDAVQIVRNLVGDESLEVTIRSTSTWTVNEMYASNYAAGRVFCMGDAVHRHPPTNGLGSNTSIQDAYNLCWKLKLVLENRASPTLLDTYSAERQPVGRQVVKRANKSIRDTGLIFEALGLLSSSDPLKARETIEARKAPTPEGKNRRRSIYQAIANKSYEFNCHGVEMNQRYASSAIVSDASPEPPFLRDHELHYHPTTWPGAHLPHAWVEQRGKRKSTLDLAGKGRFTLLTGIGGGCWKDAAVAVEAAYGLEVDVVSIGPAGCDALDIYADWYRLSEVDEDGCVVVRPDLYVAWRAKEAIPNASDVLVEVFGRVLGRRTEVTDGPEAVGIA
ncbi:MULTISPECIES: FAD-dependent monooxygenase [unclassified Bradyrhizobium]|uniref:FAD-dependent oxidoreductase n=1 Tax=unclassified Bradyrhizobium TaxID=2631580 RepID=UPI0024795CA3|nr:MULTISPECIES: FAD-dependent monooxygenase [unclassified Bradyrhizobium]WGR73155.1 FAD-dependent monooxygenase [Bradyrhizobium sp. ISRA426]WGR77995.1 FAD-dependent monooxygenase [Bradyrhizobium sp. ISRA430]WGR88396.1 FAD-dependent monooxygenase [Bradyrhizobium sp. ISRA432]